MFDECDVLFLLGGYLELYVVMLVVNVVVVWMICVYVVVGWLIVVECGGMVYLCELLIDVDGLMMLMFGVFWGYVMM